MTGDGSPNEDDARDRDGSDGRPAEGFDELLDLSSHFYRGEMDRITTWRTRMDQTTNWAVVVMAAILTWAFSSPDNPHYVILIGALAAGVFLFIEAKRFQEYDAWRDRIRLLQQSFFAEGYEHHGPDSESWRARLSDDLREPTIDLSLSAALGHRLQHVYLPLLTVLLTAWGLRVTVFESGERFTQTAAIGDVPGATVVVGVVLVYAALAVLAVQSYRRHIRREFEYETDSSGTTEGG